MSVWKALPFVRLLLPFILGIVAAVYLSWEGGAILILFLFLPFLGNYFTGYRYRWVFGVLLSIALFLFGLQLVRLMESDKELTEEEAYYVVELLEQPQEKANSWKALARLLPEEEKVLLYFQKNSVPPAYGSRLLLRARFQSVEPPQNPGEFNYQRFLALRQIHYQAFVKKRNWVQIDQGGNDLKRKAIAYRGRLLDVLSEEGIVGEQHAIASALLLGFKGDLRTETRYAFATAGAMHILAVSGLHVGIIYLLLHSFFLFMERHRYLKLLKVILLISLLWGYALLTGLSPSVMRAASMFSFVIVGKAIDRQSNIYNTLAASAFFLLITNPFLLFEVGFQLSYLAVLGIVFLQNELYKMLAFKSWILDKMWAITCVSIAAQIATFPLGLLYFHQFPNYFLLSNLVVIPLATIILQLGVGLFTVQSLSFLAEPLAWLLRQSLSLLLQFVQWVQELPYALSSGITINVAETYLLYAALLGLAFALVRKEGKYLRYGLSFLLLFTAWDTYEDCEQAQQTELLVYKVKKHTAIAFIQGREAVVLMDSVLLHDENKQRFHLMHHWWNRGLNVIDKRSLTDSVHTDFLFKEGSHIQFADKRILLLDAHYQKQLTALPVTVDFVLLTATFNGSLKNIMQAYNFKKVLLDGSLSYYQKQKWERECEGLGLECGE